MTVNIASLVSDNLEVWTAAIERKSSSGRGGGRRISLYGIERLRALILDLGVRGKLVPQDANDEPAAQLLEHLKRNKTRRIRSGEIRQPRELDDGSNLKVPFALPETWEWVRLDEVGAIVGGGTPPAGNASNFVDGGKGVAWVTPADLGGYKGQYISHGERDLTEAAVKASSATVMPAGSVLFTSRAPIGYVVIAANPISTNQGFKSIVPYIPECSRFIALAMKSFAKAINEGAPGTTFKEVSGKMVAAIAFPLPPLAEQQRIVSKVDDLLALCDVLEVESAAAITAHHSLVEALLATLTSSADATDLAANWIRLAVHFDIVFTTEASVDALKQTVLELAVQGKLVLRNKGDEPAIALVQRWEAAKQKALETAGDHRIKLAPKPNTPPFNLPPHWETQSFENMFLFIDYRGNTPPKTESGVPLITAKNVRIGYLDREPREFVAESTFKDWMTRGFPGVGDLFFTTEAPLGNICLNDIEEPFAIAQRLICLQPYGSTNNHFYMLAIMSQSMQRVIDENATGMTARGIKAAKLKPIPLPVPPEAEQARIVAKVGELMTVCDALKASIVAASSTQRSLADSIMESIAC